SSSVATEAESVSPRDLARHARESLDAARDALREGHALQVYPEGARSRTHRLGPFLRGVHRYLADPVRWVVPAAILGTERVFPVDATALSPSEITLMFAPPIAIADAGGPRDALEQAHRAI